MNGSISKDIHRNPKLLNFLKILKLYYYPILYFFHLPGPKVKAVPGSVQDSVVFGMG